MRRFLLGFVAGILTIPVAGFAAAWLGWLPVNANATPSAVERAFMHLALDRAAARRAPHLANPVAPTEANLMAGMKLFKGDCNFAREPKSQTQKEPQRGRLVQCTCSFRASVLYWVRMD